MFNLHSVKNTVKSEGKEMLIGYYISTGSINGKEVFKGPRGGIYYYTGNNNKVSLNDRQKKDNIRFINN